MGESSVGLSATGSHANTVGFRCVKRAVFELHHTLTDTTRCRQVLADAGLNRIEHLWERDSTSTDVFWK